MRYQDYIFDLYGTLVDIRTDEESPTLWAGMAEYYSRQGAICRPDELRDAYRCLVSKAEHEAPSLCRDAHEAHPEIQIELVFQQLFRDRGVEADLEQAIQAGLRFRALSTQYIRLYDGARELLNALREQGRVWLLSNAQSAFTRWELERLGLTSSFDGIYLSSDHGVKKPDRCFFDILFREQGIRPERAVMIGNDGVCDIQGGRAAGLDTFYIRSNLSPKEPIPQADYVLPTMNLRRVGQLLGLFSV